MILKITSSSILLCILCNLFGVTYSRLALKDGPRPRNYTSPTHPEEEPPMDSKIVGADTGLNISDYIRPCNETSRECLVKSTQDAIPEFVKGLPHLGVPQLDPFTIEKLSIPLSGLKVTFYEGKVSGFKKCIVDNVVSELEKRHFVLEFHCNLTIKGGYDAVGKVLLFPINGEGDAKIKLTNLKMKVDINTKYIKDDKGVNHFGIKNYKYTFDYGDKVTFDLQNLFKESKELSNTVLAFLNENWRTVSEEFGKPIVDYAVELAIKTIEKFFLVVPYEELINVPIPI